MAKFIVQCTGKNTDKEVHKNVKDVVTFDTAGKCKFITFDLVPPNPPGFTGKSASPDGRQISYDYDGTPMPAKGYPFRYKTDSKLRGNGTGVIKNV